MNITTKVVSLSELKLNKDNPRVLKDETFNKLKKSIQEFPEMLQLREVIVDENMTILGGNMRYKALQDLGIKEAQVKIIEGLSEEQKKEFIIKDNVSFGEWDWDVLANEWDTELLNDWGLNTPDEWEVEEVEAQEDNFETPEPNEIKTDIVLGDLFEFRKDGKTLHRLMCGDSTQMGDVEKLLQGNKINCIITDPPYNLLEHKIETGINTDDLFSLMYSVLEDKSFCSFFGQHPTVFDFLTSAYKYKFNYKNEIIWDKATPSSVFTEVFRTHENCFIFTKGRAEYYKTEVSFSEWLDENWIDRAESVKRELSFWKAKAQGKKVKGHSDYGKEIGGTTAYDNYYSKMTIKDAGLGVKKKKIQTVWKVLRDSFAKKQKGNSLHVTQKPIEFLSRLVKMISQKEMTILDLFLGSGSTMVASHQLNRRCYGLELDPKYCQVIIDRMKKLDPEIEIIKTL